MLTITRTVHKGDASFYTQESSRHGVDSSTIGQIMHMAAIIVHHPEQLFNYKPELEDVKAAWWI